jgi:hypothetical protein
MSSVVAVRLSLLTLPLCKDWPDFCTDCDQVEIAEQSPLAQSLGDGEELLLEEPPQPAAITTASPTGRSASFMRPTFSPSGERSITLYGRS